MDPQDDPETRIRELERPLTDEALASEQGASGYAYPPTPPPGTYGAPVPPRPIRTGFRGWWIVLAVFAVGTVALGVGIAALGAHLFTKGRMIVVSPATPSTSSVANIPTSPPGGATQAPTGGAPTSTPPPGGNLSVAGIGENETIACNDSFVSVSGFSNTVVITGHCASLTVSGAKNVITVDAADSIDASGFNNQVTFHSGSPHIDKSGEGNVVQQG
jgi:Protein of unknown function (DUF3060)